MKKILFITIFLFFVANVAISKKINYKSLKWQASADAVSYKVYCAPMNPDYNSPFVSTTELSLKLDESVCGLQDGNEMFFGVAAVNSAGNEADIVPSGGISYTPFFTCPAPVTNVIIE